MILLVAFLLGLIFGALAWDTFLGWLHRSVDAATTLPAPDRLDVRS